MGYRGMITVSNTTPLRYLIATGRDHLLGKSSKKRDCPCRLAHKSFLIG